MSLSIFYKFITEQFSAVPYPEGPLDGKTIIITGSNTGLGMEAARHVVRLNAATLILAVRTIERGEKAKKDILASLPNAKTTVHVWKLDLSTFASTRAFAEKVIHEVPRLDAAILNAALATGDWELSPDGWENTLQTNDLSTAYLALLLYPKLKEAARDKGAGAFLPHLSIVASEVHEFTPFVERKAPNILAELNNKAKFKPSDRYNISKLLNMYIASSIADVAAREDSGVVVNVLNPGLCHSELSRNAKGIQGWMLETSKFLIGRKTEVGSRTLVHAATQNGMETHGKYLSTCRIREPGHFVIGPEGPELKKKVWSEIGEVLVQQDPELKYFFT